jgi:hypothetical protein
MPNLQLRAFLKIKPDAIYSSKRSASLSNSSPNILRSMVPRPCGPLCPRRSDAGHVLPTAQSQKTGSKTSFGRFTQGARTTDVNRESSICRHAIPTVRFGDVPTTGSTTWPERVRRSAAVRSARYTEPAIDADERSTKVCWDLEFPFGASECDRLVLFSR